MTKAFRSRRRGVVLIVALVCLLVAMSLLGHMLLAALRSGRQLHAERDLRQCELLLQAGVDRGLTQIANEPDYRGEVRDIPSAEILGHEEGRISIEVLRPADAAPQLQVIAEYPAGSETSARRSRVVSLPVKP